MVQTSMETLAAMRSVVILPKHNIITLVLMSLEATQSNSLQITKLCVFLTSNPWPCLLTLVGQHVLIMQIEGTVWGQAYGLGSNTDLF